MTETVKLGVPVVVTIDRNNPAPDWLINFAKSADPIYMGPLEHEVKFTQNNGVTNLIFPTEGHYTMFVLKWS